ncbi:polysaccharide biosynthesis/export family protein [Gloeobacter violaceus]|uniref:Gll3717 protein n=1 Tax=Gloeobacter violaceus (strain ATCC 29082 / PCC 7421) TaxID=251221 RepID=Q7NF10_GLOVI|nr:polysaccharide biosynthesis/export family protein [Gloeobacter violaceus]BAC91658.1 gll3717 [Gloeobacter violaceus PCC 7421]
MVKRFAAALLAGVLGGACLAPGAVASTLSAFDRISVIVTNGEEFSSQRGGRGDEGYLVGADGNIFIYRLGSIAAAGREEVELQQEITERLREYFKVPEVTVRLIGVSPINVDVAGAVYRPGLITVKANGDTPSGASSRTVFNAIQSAGGVRPDADLSRIRLERAGQSLVLPPGQDAPVIYGDRVIIDRLAAGQAPVLHVATQLTPAEITVYVSGTDARENQGPVKVKPGTTLSGALTAAGISGESYLREGRKVALIRRDPVEGKREVTSYDIAGVMGGESDPPLWDGDAIAITAGPSQNTMGFLDMLSPLLNPLGFMLRAFIR